MKEDKSTLQPRLEPLKEQTPLNRNPLIAASADGQEVRLFKHVEEWEAEQFREWARVNYKVGEPINPCWHPLIQAECQAMNAGRFVLHTVGRGGRN